MNKKLLIKLYKKMSPESLTFEEAKREVDTFNQTLMEALVVDGSIKFMGKGVFEIISRQSKIISNPVTRERMTIYPKKKVKFRVSGSLSK